MSANSGVIAFGWYDRADQKEPTYDPGLVDCPVCHALVTQDNVRTISLLHDDRRSLFYRMHRTCAEGLTEDQRDYYDEAVMHGTEAGQP